MTKVEQWETIKATRNVVQYPYVAEYIAEYLGAGEPDPGVLLIISMDFEDGSAEMFDGESFYSAVLSEITISMNPDYEGLPCRHCGGPVL